MRVRTRNRSAGALVAAVAVLVASGCTGSDAPLYVAPPGPTDAEKRAAAKARAADGVEMLEATWAAELRAGTNRFSEATVDAGVSTRASGVTIVGKTAEDSAGSATIRQGTNVGRYLIVDSLVYMDLGPATGGKYLRIDPNRPGPGQQQFGDALEGLDHAGTLATFSGAVEDFRELVRRPWTT